ncbi:SMI1/KNR4 family protein [Acidobacteria bacterium ACD]|nr:MAG: SMI1/KNR4 family protein [Acidobacteriota bacterium]MCE7959990.1 SMI1/KNR4 family protein [Acidobacteria bacterium ACB2]MDL1951393.1 SMI1/KNR4 family protein [Acidobacteria bacterium ACD]
MVSGRRTLEVEGPLPPPTAEEVAAIEEELGARLPAGFLEFLSSVNGGWLDYSFDVPVGGRGVPVSFHSLHHTRRPSMFRPSPGAMLHEIRAERRTKGVARQLLPFASDGGASVVFLDLTPEGNGRVVAYVEGLPGWDGDPASAFVVLAPDFAGFVDGLYRNLEEPRRHGE